jgi:hypothetical protein
MNRRNLRATFIIGDVFQVSQLGRTYDTVLDSATFHNFTDQQRLSMCLPWRYRSGGTLHLICFSQHEKRAGGPRRITAEEPTSLPAFGKFSRFGKSATRPTDFRAVHWRAAQIRRG